MEHYFLKKQGGQSLVEILVGLTLLTLAISAAVTIVFGSQSIVIDRDNTVTAELYSKEGIVATNALTKNDWVTVTDGNHGLSFINGAWQFSGTSDTQSIFTRVINITTTALSEERKITSTVTWQASPLRPQKKVETVTYISNWANVLATGNDTGGGGTSGNWVNPVSLSSIDIGAGNSATDVDVVGNTVYVASEASNKSKADIHSYDITNPATPTLLSEIDVDAYSLQSIDANSGYIYGAATGVIPDLKVINNSNPSNLGLTSEYNVITFVDATKVFRDDDTIYLGVKKTTFNGELFTIDVTNPSSPNQLGVFEVNGNVNGLTEQNGLAYLATSHDSHELQILDVTNPASITQAGYLDIAGATDATSIFVVNSSRVFLGVGNILYLLNALNPTSVTTLGTYNAGGTINDIYVAGDLAFLATSNSTQELQIVNIANPASPVIWSSLNFPQNATGIDYLNNLIFVSVKSNDGLRIITSSAN